MRRMFFANALVIDTGAEVVVLLGAEEPASYRSPHAVDAQTLKPVKAPEQGYLNGAIGFKRAIRVPKVALGQQQLVQQQVAQQVAQQVQMARQATAAAQVQLPRTKRRTAQQTLPIEPAESE